MMSKSTPFMNMPYNVNVCTVNEGENDLFWLLLFSRFHAPEKMGYAYTGYGAACSEMEVDVLTGEYQLIRADLMYDCGERWVQTFAFQFFSSTCQTNTLKYHSKQRFLHKGFFKEKNDNEMYLNYQGLWYFLSSALICNLYAMYLCL